MNASELRDIIEWMIGGARSAPTPPQMMAECCERLVRAGLPLWRIGVFVRTLHPEIYGRHFFWKPGAEVETGTVDHNILDSPEFAVSPLSTVFRQGVEVRARLDDPASARFPIVVDLQAEGGTDYIAVPLVYTDGFVNASSWTTRQPGGFTDEQLDAIRSIAVPLARYIEIITLRRTASLLLDTYVGNRAGERIMGGQIRRGHADTMDAAIWLSDLRGFTALSDRLPAETVVEILNLYFDCQVSAIRSAHAYWKPRARPAPASRRCNSPMAMRSNASVSASRCISGACSTAISAAATGSTSPASVRRSISPRGWRRSPAVSAAPWWPRSASPASATAAGAISASFRSRDLPRPNGSTACTMRRRSRLRASRRGRKTASGRRSGSTA